MLEWRGLIIHIKYLCLYLLGCWINNFCSMDLYYVYCVHLKETATFNKNMTNSCKSLWAETYYFVFSIYRELKREKKYNAALSTVRFTWIYVLLNYADSLKRTECRIKVLLVTKNVMPLLIFYMEVYSIYK